MTSIGELSPWYQSFNLGEERTSDKEVSGDFLWEKIEPMLPNLVGKRVLDLGCNAGYYSFKMAELGAYVTAVEKSDHYLRQAEFCRRFFKNSENVEFVEEDLQSYQPSFRSFLVMALSILYHLKRPEWLLRGLDFDYILVRTRSDKPVDKALAKSGLIKVDSLVESPRRELALYRRPCYVAIVSMSGSGHSLLSSLLDAHKNVAMSREVLVVRRLLGGMDPRKIPAMVSKASKRYTEKGRFHRGSGTSHLVPGMWSGRTMRPLVFGDKNGQGVVGALLDDPSVFNDIASAGFSLKFIVMRRNSGHLHSFVNGWRHKFGDKVEYRFQELSEELDQAVEVVKRSGQDFCEISYEDLVGSTSATLAEVLSFLGLDVSEDYLEACSSIVLDPCPVVENLEPGRR